MHRGALAVWGGEKPRHSSNRDLSPLLTRNKEFHTKSTPSCWPVALLVTMASQSPASSDPTHKKIDPKLATALRFTISAKEYGALHALLQKRAPKQVEQRAVGPKAYAAALHGKDDYNAAAVRAAVRVFLVSRAGLGLYDALIALIRRRRGVVLQYVLLSVALGSVNSSLTARQTSNSSATALGQHPPVSLPVDACLPPPHSPPLLHAAASRSPLTECRAVPKAQPSHFPGTDI